MKLAIITVTANGARLAERVIRTAAADTYCDLFVKAGRNPLSDGQEYHSLSKLVTEIFSKYDALLFIMATGIVVRVIAPHVQDKRVDPAVIVADETGRHVISLLSGHIGGANEITRTIAGQLGAEPVITTATDVGGKPAADVLAVKAGLKIESFAGVKQINAAIAAGQPVTFFLDHTLPQPGRYLEQAAALGITLEDFGEFNENDTCAAVVITDKNQPQGKEYLLLRPPTLAAGIGCRRGTTQEEILAAVYAACDQIGRSMSSIAVIGSTVVKQDEPGLLAAAKTLTVPINFYDNKQLAAVIEKYQLDISDFVKAQIGVGNVCEAAAILASQSSEILLPKTTFSRVTVALTLVK